jgi:hypothetical protein
VHFGQADEENAEQSQAIPLVVGQDVKVVEHVLMEEMGLVEQEYGMRALLAELLDMARHLKEDGGGGGFWGKAECQAELAIEVSTTEGGIMAIGEPEAGLGQMLLQCTQYAGLADAGLAGEQHVAMLGAGVDQFVDDVLT